MVRCRSLQVLCFTGVLGLVISRAESLSDTGQAPTSEIRYFRDSSEPLDQASHSDLSPANAGTPSKRHIHTAGTLKDKDAVNQGNKHQPQLKLFTLPPKPTSRPLISRYDSAIRILTSTRNSTSVASSTPPTEYDFTEMSVQVSVHESPSISSYNISKLDAGRDVITPPKYDYPALLPIHGYSDDESVPNTVPSVPASEPEPSSDSLYDDETIPDTVTSMPISEPEPNSGFLSDDKRTDDSQSLDKYTFSILDSSYIKTTTPSSISLTVSNSVANISEQNITDNISSKPFSLHALLKSNIYYGILKPIHRTSKPNLSTLASTVKPFYTPFSLDPKYFQSTTPTYNSDNSKKHSNTPKHKTADESDNFMRMENIQDIDLKDNTVPTPPKSFNNEPTTEIPKTSNIFDSEFAESSLESIHAVPEYLSLHTNQTHKNISYLKALENKQTYPIKKHSQPALPESYLTKFNHADDYSNKYKSNIYNKESTSLYNGASFDPISLQIIPASPSYKHYGDIKASNKDVNRSATNNNKAEKSNKYDPNLHVNEYKSRPFSFEYHVKDKHMGTDFSHHEKSDGRVTAGRYTVLLPDGRRQVVSFTADHLHLGGYQATVEYEGHTPKYKDMIITTNKSVEIHSYKDSSSTSLNEVDSFDYPQQIQEHKNGVTPTLLYAPAPVLTYAPTHIPTSTPVSTKTYTPDPEPISAPAPVATYAPAPITPSDLSLQHTSPTGYALTTPAYHSTTFFSLDPDDTYSSDKNNNIQYHKEELSKIHHTNSPPAVQRSFRDYGLNSGRHFHHGHGHNISPTKRSSQIRDVLPYRIVGYTGWDEVFAT